MVAKVQVLLIELGFGVQLVERCLSNCVRCTASLCRDSAYSCVCLLLRFLTFLGKSDMTESERTSSSSLLSTGGSDW